MSELRVREGVISFNEDDLFTKSRTITKIHQSHFAYKRPMSGAKLGSTRLAHAIAHSGKCGEFSCSNDATRYREMIHDSMIKK